MKRQSSFLTILFLSCAALVQGQKVHHYPVLSNAQLKDKKTATLDATHVAKGEEIRFSISLLNMDGTEPVKAGSCEVVVELGENVKLVEWAGQWAMPLTQYLKWTVRKNENGTTRLTGKVVADLPADFAAPVELKLYCPETGASSIKAYLWLPLEKGTGSIASATSLDVSVKRKKNNG